MRGLLLVQRQLGAPAPAALIKLTNVIGNIYDAAVDASLWQHALGSLCAYVGSSSAALFRHDAAPRNAQALYLSNGDPDFARLYFEKCFGENFFSAASRIEAGVVQGTTDILPKIEIERTRSCKAWLESLGIATAIAIKLEKGTAPSSFSNIPTDVICGMVDDRMRECIGELVPHLQRAIAIGRLFDRHRSVEQTAANVPPPMEAVATFYRLTAGEVRVLDAMLKIDGVKAIADLLGITKGTVRTHLHNLFRKTGTQRQSELVKLIAGI